jgi:L-ascorbate metabolism protein UlaG (beta-lactamase superfamily)
MEITLYGAGCVRLVGKRMTVVCDPFSNEMGLGKYGLKSDAITLSTEDLPRPQGAGLIIEGPGEYEVQGAMITGVPAQLNIDEGGKRCTIYSITMDGVNVVVTGNIIGKLSGAQIEAIGKVDVLVLPVGNHGLTMDAESAAAVASQLEPSYVVPVHYDDGKTVYPVPQDGVDVFLKEMGSVVEPVAKLKINPKELPEQTQVVVLQLVGSN